MLNPWAHADALTVVLALLLVAMSVASWVVILWKTRWLWRVGRDVPRCIAAFWQAPNAALAEQTVQALDREGCVAPLLRAAQPQPTGSLGASAARHEQLTRSLRQALGEVAQQLHWGQTVLATTGSLSPFVGLLGTVWGIFNALLGMAEAGALTIERVAAPVGEALIMTAVGLGVAIPAVLAYNLLGRHIAHTEAELEGFAHDLRGLWAPGAPD